jgi:hypothetical protein
MMMTTVWVADINGRPVAAYGGPNVDFWMARGYFQDDEFRAFLDEWGFPPKDRSRYGRRRRPSASATHRTGIESVAPRVTSSRGQ